MRVAKITSLFSLIFLLSFFLILPYSFAETFEITLHKGWNAISIPYKEFKIIKIEGKIYPQVYIYEPFINSNSYTRVSIDSLDHQRGGIWVYSFQDNSKIIIDGQNRITFPSLFSYIFTSPQKATWSFIPTPIGKLKASNLGISL